MIEHVSRFLDFLDNRQIFRRIAFVAVLAMTWEITQWAMGFAQSWLASNKSGVDVGTVIGAVTLPFAALQGVVLKIYTDSRGTS